MSNINSKAKFVIFIFLGIIIGFVLTFVIFNTENAEIKKQSNICNKKIELKNQNTGNFTKKLPNTSQNPSNYENKNETCSNILKQVNYSGGLLSPRVYAGVLEPRSFLITNLDPLKNDLQSYLQEQNINTSIYVENLRNGVNFGIRSGRGYFPASLNKLPIAVLIMQNIEYGKISFNTTFPIMDDERTDSSGTLYLTPAKELTVRELLERMLKESDNTAFNVLYHHADKNELGRLLDYYNVKINVNYPYRRLEYANQTDLVTTVSLYNIFSSLYLSTVLYEPDSEYILSLLKNTEFNIKGIANLPDDIVVVQKYGEYYIDDTKLFHDCGIMYVGQSRLFYCIMTKDLEAEDAKRVIGHVVNHIYNFIVFARSEMKIYKNETERNSNSLNALSSDALINSTQQLP